MLDSMPLCLPSFISFCKGKCFTHEILVDDSVEVSLFVKLVLLDKEILNHLWVLNNHADNACIDNHDDRVVFCIKFAVSDDLWLFHFVLLPIFL